MMRVEAHLDSRRAHAVLSSAICIPSYTRPRAETSIVVPTSESTLNTALKVLHPR